MTATPRPRRTTSSRRRATRALPVALVAVVAFGAGAMVGGGSAERDAAVRFAEAWAAQDFEAMYAELSPAAQTTTDLRSFTRTYEKAQERTSIRGIGVGDSDGPTDSGDTQSVEVALELSTAAFGELKAPLEIPVSSEGVEWNPSLTFPGLREDEKLKQSIRPAPRGDILADDGTKIAVGDQGAVGDPAISSLVGQVSEPTPEEQEDLRARGLPDDTLIGHTGLELAFEDHLAGKPGGKLLAVPDGKGEKRILAESEPVKAKPVKTTIDPRVQKAAVEGLAGRIGGVAAIDARDGSIRALAGVAFSTPQPPGSVFKIITASAALEEGITSLNTNYPVVVSAPVGGRELANAHDEPCGGSLLVSFALSCNSVFGPLGVELGAERLFKEAEQFGYNEQPQIYYDKAVERIDPPTPSIPEEIGTDTDVGVTAIGQGRLLTTPLQVASSAQAIANGGIRSPNSIVKNQSLRPDTEDVRVTTTKNAERILDMMVAVVNAGTGSAAKVSGVQVAGKTGTAEIGPKTLDPGEEPPPVDPVTLEPDEPEQAVDAWFTGFAPAKATRKRKGEILPVPPKLVVAVMLIDSDADGGSVAAPVAQQVLAAGL